MAKQNKVSMTVSDGKSAMHDMARAVQSRPAVAIDCPSEDETVACPFYTVKVSAESAAGVEVCIDNGPWLPCREALGLWWFDMCGFKAGEHQVTARTNLGDGLMVSSAPRRFMAE